MLIIVDHAFLQVLINGDSMATLQGVISVTQIFNYYKKHGYNTIVMGASFRNTDEIIELTGCDRLTISPDLLDKLAAATDKIEVKLDAGKAADMDIKKIDIIILAKCFGRNGRK